MRRLTPESVWALQLPRNSTGVPTNLTLVCFRSKQCEKNASWNFTVVFLLYDLAINITWSFVWKISMRNESILSKLEGKNKGKSIFIFTIVWNVIHLKEQYNLFKYNFTEVGWKPTFSDGVASLPAHRLWWLPCFDLAVLNHFLYQIILKSCNGIFRHLDCLCLVNIVSITGMVRLASSVCSRMWRFLHQQELIY